MSHQEIQLAGHIQAFRKKYYLNQMIRGGIMLLLVISSLLFVSILSEGLLGLSSSIRTGLFILLSGTFLLVFAFQVLIPMARYVNLSRPLDEIELAQLIRRYFPEVDDKLINLIQLRKSKQHENALAIAAIEKKTNELAPISFSSAINLNINWKYARYLLIPLLLFLLVFGIAPDILKTGSSRLINFTEEYIPPPPFSIDILNNKQQLVAGENLNLEAIASGNELPNDLYLYIRKTSESRFVNYPMKKLKANKFSFLLEDVKENFSYYVGNQLVKSEIKEISVLKRPNIEQFRVVLQYPSYTRLQSDTLQPNIGDFKVIKGTQVKWVLNTSSNVKEALYIGSDTANFKLTGNQYAYDKRIFDDERYFISLRSTEQINNIDTGKYNIETLQDRHPSVYIVTPKKDFQTDYRMQMPLEFELSDDYGFSKLKLYYRFVNEGQKEPFEAIDLSVERYKLLQQKALEVDLANIGMQEGDQIEYYIQVWDNDIITGPKSSKSEIYSINYPSLEEQYKEVEENQEKMDNTLDSLANNVERIQEDIEKFQEKLLDKRNLNFDDKRQLKSIINQHKSVQEQLNQLKRDFEENKDKLENNQLISQETLEKYEQLNELIEKMNNPKLDELMEKLNNEMEKLNPDDLKEQMEQLELNEEDLKNSIDWTQKLLQQLEIEQKTEELIQKLDNLQAKQDFLNEKTEQENKLSEEERESLANQQQKLKEEMNQLEKELKELAEMKKDSPSPNEEQMKQLEKDAKDTQEQMQNASEQMQQNKQKKSSQSQKNASSKMQEMKQQLQNMQMQAQQQQDKQNLEGLRDILENLLKLSFSQEDLRDKMQGMRANDPALIESEREQKKLRDDMEMVKDSLKSLAKKVFQIEKIIIDESNTIMQSMKRAQHSMDNKYMNNISRHQHQAMTSMNTLANMLTEVMQQMQQQMQQGQQKPSDGKCNKPGMGQPGMKKIGQQQQELNQMMQQMLGKGMNPQKLKEMAARQEKIRQQLKEAHEKIKEQGGKALGDVDGMMQDMKMTEEELRKNILTQETIQRQSKLLDRLLDSYKAVREKEKYDDKRESKSGNPEDRIPPEKLSKDEYRQKLRQELLKVNQLEYSPDFVKLIEKYFKLLEKAE